MINDDVLRGGRLELRSNSLEEDKRVRGSQCVVDQSGCWSEIDRPQAEGAYEQSWICTEGERMGFEACIWCGLGIFFSF